jgi:hypothetical protein
MLKTNYVRFFTLALAVKVLLTFIALPANAQPQLRTKNTSVPGRLVFQEDFDPPGDGEPKGTSGAGSRSGDRCAQNEMPIRPLMPKRNYGLTVQERPRLFVSLPKTAAKQVVLTLQDEAGTSYQRAFLPIPAGADGIASFALPDDKPPLAVGKNYQWSLVVVCGASVQPDDPIFRGWVQRVALTPQLQSQIRQKSAIEQAVWYGQEGYWYDMVATIVQAKRSHPNDRSVVAQWQQFLELVMANG